MLMLRPRQHLYLGQRILGVGVPICIHREYAAHFGSCHADFKVCTEGKTPCTAKLQAALLMSDDRFTGSEQQTSNNGAVSN